MVKDQQGFDPKNFISATNDLTGVTFTYSTGVSTTLSGEALKAWVTLYRAMLMMFDTAMNAKPPAPKKSITKTDETPNTGVPPYDR